METVLETAQPLPRTRALAIRRIICRHSRSQPQRRFTGHTPRFSRIEIITTQLGVIQIHQRIHVPFHVAILHAGYIEGRRQRIVDGDCHGGAVDRSDRIPGGAMRGSKHQAEITGAGDLLQRLQSQLDLPVQMQDHFAHQRRIGAHFISQQRARIQDHAQQIERSALAQPFLGKQGAEKLELGVLREWRGVIERHEIVGTRGVVDQDAQRGGVGIGLQSVPVGVLEPVRSVGLPE